ncbi:hypothetical protein BDR03DRAFT_686553 [Suillus americanus]|nr:hypothetical protein BDR03DRAFT_686553 [Suillus americanus]
MHISVFGESDDNLSEISDDELPKAVANVHLIVHPAQNAKVEPAPSLSARSNSFQPVPPTKRIAKRRLIVDSDEEEIRATAKNAQRATVSPAKPDINIETITTELGKTRRVDDRRSSAPRSSSLIETDHLQEVKRPCTPSSKEASHPGPTDNVAETYLNDDAFSKDASAYDQVPPCRTIPDAQLTAHGIIPASLVQKNLAAGNGTVWRVSPSKLVDLANIPAKLAGTRRKRDDANSPMRAPKVLEDDHPPKKKARNTTSGDIPIKGAASILPDPSEPPMSSTTVAKAPRKYGKKGKALSPALPGNVDFDEVPGATSKGKTNARAKAVRVSKPAPKKVPAPISGRQTRAGAMRCRNEKPLEFESPKHINPKLQPTEADTGIVPAPKQVDQIPKVESLHNDATNGPSVSLKPESALRKKVNQMDMDRAGTGTAIARKILTKTKTGNTNAMVHLSITNSSKTDIVSDHRKETINSRACSYSQTEEGALGGPSIHCATCPDRRNETFGG